MGLPPLDLRSLNQGFPALTPALGTAMAESAAVCLEVAGHCQPRPFNIYGDIEHRYDLGWEIVTEQMRRTYNDHQDATRDGATGIAILLLCNLADFVVVERSAKGTGIDYWLGDANSDPELPFQNKSRLEVSGILRENEGNTVADRLRTKMKQSKRSDATVIPAIVVIVEFGAPQAVVRRR